MSTDAGVVALPKRVEVVVLGAGTAGAAAAALCARRGLRVACIDRSPLDGAGARWVNGVPKNGFVEAGIEPSSGDELVDPGGPFHLVSGYGPTRITITDHGVMEVDMRHLVARLQRLAREAGATLIGNTTVQEIDDDVVETNAGAVRADWIVDATGLAGLRLLDSPKVGRSDICAAAQYVHHVADKDAARAFFSEHRVPLGEVLCFAGIAGGYSILNMRCHGNRIGFLTGSIPGDGHPSGKAILDDFVAANPWVGEREFGGSRAIPLRRPYDQLAAGRIALLGDAGCQVFSAHGSGIAAGMVAARFLADALAEGRGVHGYEVSWQRAYGGLYAAYDLFRRFSQAMQPGELERMMTSGLIDPELARYGMAQQNPRVSLRSIPGKLVALAGNPRLALRLARVAARMTRARRLYARYPENRDYLPAWSKRVARICGGAPDVTEVTSVGLLTSRVLGVKSSSDRRTVVVSRTADEGAP